MTRQSIVTLELYDIIIVHRVPRKSYVTIIRLLFCRIRSFSIIFSLLRPFICFLASFVILVLLYYSFIQSDKNTYSNT